MINEEKNVLLFDPVMCSGCLRCMTTCSTYKYKKTSLVNSHIYINRYEGFVVSHKLDSDDNLLFDASIDPQCDHCDGHPQCVKLCGLGALKYVPESAIKDIQIKHPSVKIVPVISKTEFPKKIPVNVSHQGYAGNTLIINLTELKATALSTDEFLVEYDIDPKLWLGGDGFITKILWKDFEHAVDPLGPDNEIILTTGPGRQLLLPGQEEPCWVASVPKLEV